MVGVRFNFMTMLLIEDASVLAAFLDAFDPDFTPTNAAPEEQARAEYGRDAFLTAVAAARKKLAGAFPICGIARRKAPTFSGHFWSGAAKQPSYLSLTFDEVARAQIPPILALADRLAAALKLDYGTAHLTFRGAAQLYNAGGRTPPKDLQKHGPMPLGARTWRGPHLIELIGRDNLEHCGVRVTRTPWGALRIDLLDDLANQSME